MPELKLRNPAEPSPPPVKEPINPPENPDPANGYQAIYFYFFGRDLRRGETVHWRLRWVISHDLSEPDIQAHWQAFA